MKCPPPRVSPQRPGRCGIAYTPSIVWELIFMMVILKIPIAYLCCVVYWAVKAEPKPPEPVQTATRGEGPEPKAPWSPPARNPRPRRGPERGPVRARRAAVPR
jgi:hypothetical protein